MSTDVNQTENQNDELRMVFLSLEEFHRAHTGILRGTPFEEGPGSVIVPAKMVALLQKAGIIITHVLKPTHENNLTSEQIKQWISKKAAFWGPFFVTAEILNYCKHKEIANAKAKKN